MVCSDDLEKQNPLRSIYSQEKGARERSFVFIAHRDFVYISRYGYTHIGLPSEYQRVIVKTPRGVVNYITDGSELVAWHIGSLTCGHPSAGGSGQIEFHTGNLVNLPGGVTKTIVA